MKQLAAQAPPFDLIMEATGKSEPGFEAMEILGNNGVLMLLKEGGGEGFLKILRDETPRVGHWIDNSDQTPEQTVAEIIARMTP